MQEMSGLVKSFDNILVNELGSLLNLAIHIFILVITCYTNTCAKEVTYYSIRLKPYVNFNVVPKIYTNIKEISTYKYMK